MKAFKLLSIHLMSTAESKAKEVKFHPKRTIVLGKNQTGKSCLMKSIYQTFGAEPQNIHPQWSAINAIVLVKFTVDGLEYGILRTGKLYGIFNQDGQQIEYFTKVSELGNYLARLLDFKLKLIDRSGEIATPPPAFLFLPYYADQDKSWTANWVSFSKLGQFPKFRTDLVNYHTGIRPNEFYEKKGELGIVNDGITKIDKEIFIVRNLLKNLKAKLSDTEFIIDLEQFQKEITSLLVTSEELNKKQNKHKYELSNLYNQKIGLESQLIITQKALQETHNDYTFAVDKLDEIVPCPSCGAEYENNFSERFSIAQDEQKCMDLIFELKEELQSLETRINKTDNEFQNNQEEVIAINKVLDTKRESVKLKDIIESEGRKEMRVFFETEINELEDVLKENLLQKATLEKELKALEDRKKASGIRDDFKAFMGTFLNKLNVHSLPEASYKRIDSVIKESGSAMPRSLMAYYYAILYVIRKNGSSAFCPIVIDSPNQQGQDSENLPILLDFIITKQPTDSQLILGLEELPDNINSSEEYIIELESHRSLMQEDQFTKVFNLIKPYLDQTLDAGLNS